MIEALAGAALLLAAEGVGFEPITEPKQNEFCSGIAHGETYLTFDMGDDYAVVRFYGADTRISVPRGFYQHGSPIKQDDTSDQVQEIEDSRFSQGPWIGSDLKVAFFQTGPTKMVSREESDSTTTYHLKMVGIDNEHAGEIDLTVTCGL